MPTHAGKCWMTSNYFLKQWISWYWNKLKNDQKTERHQEGKLYKVPAQTGPEMEKFDYSLEAVTLID